MVKYGILGAGWAGLLAAHEIKLKNPSAEVELLEKSGRNELGGLLKSEVIEGFTYDIGGPHILFSRNAQTLGQILEILGDNWKQMERKNYIHFEGRIIPYPFENGIFTLPATDRARIGSDLINCIIKLKNNPNWVPTSFLEWAQEVFGQEMASRYLIPYNRKIWKRDLGNFDASWVFTPGRLPLPELEDVIYSIAGLKTIGYKEQANFFYPKRGGIQSLFNSLMSMVENEGCKIITGVNIDSVAQSSDKQWQLNSHFEYNRIVSTLPPAHLIRSMDVPEEIRRLGDRLDYNRVVVVGIALDRPSPDQIALYVPQDDVIFHRYTWMNNLVSDSPIGKSNLIAEITIPKDRLVDPASIESEVVEGLIKLGIINNTSEIIHVKTWLHEFGYPVYMKGHNEVRNKILGFLSERNVASVGRWGSWHYWNTDKVLEAVKSCNFIKNP